MLLGNRFYKERGGVCLVGFDVEGVRFSHAPRDPEGCWDSEREAPDWESMTFKVPACLGITRIPVIRNRHRTFERNINTILNSIHRGEASLLHGASLALLAVLAAALWVWTPKD